MTENHQEDLTPSPVPAEPQIVPADPNNSPGPGAEIVGSSLQPPAGTPPGVVADTPVAAGSAADPDIAATKARSDERRKHLKDNAITADKNADEAHAGQATDPAVHNPRAPVDGTGVGNDHPHVHARHDGHPTRRGEADKA